MNTKYRMFWMVWMCGGAPPTYQHQTAESAKKEAERLAVQSPGSVFHVLQSIAACRRSDIQWGIAEEDFCDSDVPF